MWLLCIIDYALIILKMKYINLVKIDVLEWGIIYMLALCIRASAKGLVG